jgi:microcystin-dependent protein
MARTFLFANLARSSLAGGITNSAVSLTVQAGGGDLFPNPNSTQQFAMTLTDAATGLLKEIVYCISRPGAGDTMTVERGQEGYTPLNWIAGDPIANLWTAGQAQSMVQSGEQQAQSHNYAVDSGEVDHYKGAYTPTLTTRVAGMPLRLKIGTGHTNTGAPVTFNAGAGASPVVNGLGENPAAGEILAGMIYEFMWNGASYEIIGPSGVQVDIPAIEADQQQSANYTLDVGSVNAYEGVYDPPITANVGGMPLRLKIIGGHANTGPSTLDVGVGPFPIVSGRNSALVADEIHGGLTYEFIWVGGSYVLIGPSGIEPGDDPEPVDPEIAQRQAANYSVDSGAPNHYIGVYDPPITGNVAGRPLRLRIISGNASTGEAVTFDPGPGAQPVINGAGLNPVAGEIRAGMVYEFMWTGSAYEIVGPFNYKVASIIPTGTIFPFAAMGTPPGGWLLCNGASLLREDYPELNDVLAVDGYLYGSADSTHFNVPDLRGRVPAGRDGSADRLTNDYISPHPDTLGSVGGVQSVTLTISQMPAHDHPLTDPGHVHTFRDRQTPTNEQDVSYHHSGDGVADYAGTGSGMSYVDMQNATTGITIGNRGGGTPHVNLQPTIIVNYIIKT